MPYITQHAIEKYQIEQKKDNKTVFDAKWEIQELFNESNLEPMHGGLVKRIMIITMRMLSITSLRIGAL